MSSSSTVQLEMTEWVTKALTIVAIVIQVMEFLYQFIDEIEYLWKTRVRLVTILYAWSRYLALAVQIIVFILSELLEHSRAQSTCWRVFILRAVTAQISTSCLGAILMMRVYAFYNCSYRSRLILVGIFCVGAILQVIGSVLSISRIQPGPGGDLCSPKFPSGSLALVLFVSGVGLVHMTVLLMTTAQHCFTRKGRRVLRTPLVSLMLRDEISTIIWLTIVFASVAVSMLFGRQFTIKAADFGLMWKASYAWYMSLTSIAGCRMILKLRKLAYQHMQNRLPYNESNTSSQTELSAIMQSDDEESVSE